jgi:hypothetical protein
LLLRKKWSFGETAFSLSAKSVDADLAGIGPLIIPLIIAEAIPQSGF